MKIQKVKEEWKKCEPEFAVLTVVLLLFLVIGCAWILFAPKEDFSEDENRALEPTPKLSVSSLLDGTFMDSVEAVSYTHLDVYKRQVFCRVYGSLEYSEIPAGKEKCLVLMAE